MKRMIQLKDTSLFATAFLMVAFGFMSIAHAVVPAPDGGYPGQNTAEGQSALLHLVGGTYNTAVGWSSLGFNVIGNLNTAVGAGVLLFNTADENTATGVAALLSNTTANGNTAYGAFALFSNTTGFFNTAIGDRALFSNNTAGNNGTSNTAIGSLALTSNNTGNANTAVGSQSLQSNTFGATNTAIGNLALFASTTGSSNTALGDGAGINVTTANNVICIGANGNNVDNSCYIGQIFNATSAGGTAVYVNTNGRLGTSTSSRRFKEDIRPMDHASETLFSLKPVTFRYKKGVDPEASESKSQFGLVAEDVEKVNPDLVVLDKEGKPYSVRYDQVNAMLLNEFLKAHKKMEEQELTIDQLKKQVATLTAGLQKVSARLEVNKPAPQTVLNNH